MESTNMIAGVLLIVLGTSVWVFFDARSIGVKKGQLQGVCDMGPVGWFWSCAGLWLISFPAYLAKRPEYKRFNKGSGSVQVASESGALMAGDFEQQLLKLARLKDSGVLRQEEFEAKKRSILGL